MLIEKYTSNWIKDFENLKREIENGLHGLDFTIEHVGSTAVPNLDSKPIIDIDIIYTKQSDFENGSTRKGVHMQKMGIKNTQYVTVLHTDRQHPHLHIVYNRVDNDGQTIGNFNHWHKSRKIF